MIAPNCVQKNIKKAASTALRVFANLYKIINEGISKASYEKKKTNTELVVNKKKPAARIEPIKS